MSKIGRKPIALSSVKIDFNNNILVIKNNKTSLEHVLPSALVPVIDNDKLTIQLQGENNRDNKMLWGLHRALLANKIKGLEKGFKVNVKIVGLGYKAQVVSPTKLTLTLGYSHKIDYTIPTGVTITVDKPGQLVAVEGIDKALVGRVCDEIRSFRKPEPYKGTGVMREDQVIIRKAGKTKSA